MRIALEFVPGQSTNHRARLEYAFRLFCAMYRHQPQIGSGSSAAVTLTYGNSSLAKAVRLTNGYMPRLHNQPAPPPHCYTRGDQTTVLFYGVQPDIEPDWLGEIFEWVSCADEYSVTRRDKVGRIPFSASYTGRHQLDPKRPYAAIAMYLLQSAIKKMFPDISARPACPLESAQHLIINTHDVDFLPDGRLQSVHRLTKNAVISLLVNRTPDAAVEQLKAAIGVALGGGDPLDQVVPLADREHRKRVSSSFYFLCDRRHRRDGNYRIDDPATQALMHVIERHAEVGIHGTYASLDNPQGLTREFETLRGLGFRPLGSRQHWLRFTIPLLIKSVEAAGSTYDTSLGWPHVAGFRAAACFAYPPYDFERERPASFLELPLVLMDQTMAASDSAAGLSSARELLAASRQYGWGGVSVLWHPTAFGGGQFPAHVGDTFWRLMDEGLEQNDTWTSAAEFVGRVWQRYHDAGLLPQKHFS
jgi:hypothetical protein